MKVTKEILLTQEYFERIYEETSNNLAAKLTPWEKKLNHKSPIKDALCKLKTKWHLF